MPNLDDELRAEYDFSKMPLVASGLERTKATAVPSVVVLSLIVLRVTDIERTKLFYSALGLQFSREQHNQGPVHYSTSIGPTVLEIYPASQNFPITPSRLGFTVPSIPNVLERLKQLGYDSKIREQGEATNSPTVVEDPDGYIIALTQR